MCTTAKVSNVSIYRMYERIWQNAAPCGAAFWVVNADGPLSVQIQYSKVQMPRIRASRLCLEFILLLTHLSCAELISWIAVHECSDWSHHRILKMLCDLCSHTGYFFSPFSCRWDLAIGDLQPDHVEIQCKEWSLSERLPLCLPRQVYTHHKQLQTISLSQHDGFHCFPIRRMSSPPKKWTLLTPIP